MRCGQCESDAAVVQRTAGDTLRRGSLCPQLWAGGFLGRGFPLCLPAEGQAAVGWVGSPELPVPAHSHHHQQVPQDGHQYNGGDEGEQHNLLRYAEALTRTGEHAEKKKKRKEKKRSCRSSGRGSPGQHGGARHGRSFWQVREQHPHACCSEATFPPRPLTQTIPYSCGKLRGLRSSAEGLQAEDTHNIHGHPGLPVAEKPTHTVEEPISQGWSELCLMSGNPFQIRDSGWKHFHSLFIPINNVIFYAEVFWGSFLLFFHFFLQVFPQDEHFTSWILKSI